VWSRVWSDIVQGPDNWKDSRYLAMRQAQPDTGAVEKLPLILNNLNIKDMGYLSILVFSVFFIFGFWILYEIITAPNDESQP